MYELKMSEGWVEAYDEQGVRVAWRKGAHKTSDVNGVPTNRTYKYEFEHDNLVVVEVEGEVEIRSKETQDAVRNQ